MFDSDNNGLTGSSPITVLVIDDDSGVRRVVARWLAADGYHSAEAATAEAAREFLRTHPVQLITLDVRMPGVSGIELLPQIAAEYPDTPVIMMTGVQETQTAIDTLTHGACAYLTKPVKREALCREVRAALLRRRFAIGSRQYTLRLEEKVREQTVAIRSAQEETIHRLVSASMWRDEVTGTHLRRTGLLAELLAKAAGWSAAEAEFIRLAAPMHDIGKIGIPDTILRKPGILSAEELEIMKQHTRIGAMMLAGSSVPMLQMARDIALCHHERWNGEGYPAGLSGSLIPECARIVAIVDVYDAMTHDRTYRRAYAEERARTMMQRETGTQFDPRLLTLFFLRLAEVCRIAKNNPDQPVATCLRACAQSSVFDVSDESTAVHRDGPLSCA
jgi:putative two-component system response regulator